MLQFVNTELHNIAQRNLTSYPIDDAYGQGVKIP